MSLVSSTFTLSLGDRAPDFTLPDANGNLVSLQQARGARGTLVVFACNHCPYVIHLASPLGQIMQEAATRSIHCIAINSNDLTAYPQDGPEPMKQFAVEHGWSFPYLLDESQQIAKDYAAACTPDFFLFDADLRLFYAGQFDETRPRTGEVAHGSDLRDALQRLETGAAAPSNTKPSCGCNIKWKPGAAPQWFA